MAKRTLYAGIFVGIAGLAIMLFTGPIINNLYQAETLPNDGFFILNSAISLVVSYCMPFSAALIAASLVMRHAEKLEGQKHSRVDDAVAND